MELDELYTDAVALMRRAELTDDGAVIVWEVRSGREDDQLLHASTDVDEVLAFLRGLMTGEEPQ